MGVDFGGFHNHAIKGGDDVYSIGYTELIAPLIKSVQELNIKVDTSTNTINLLNDKLNELNTIFESLMIQNTQLKNNT